MFIDQSYRNFALIAAIAMLILAFPGVGHCQTNRIQENPSEEAKAPEEITVYGRQSIIKLRYEIYDAEDKFFAMFNTLNSSDEYNVICKKRFDVYKNRRIRQCYPEFLMKYLENFAGGENPNIATIRRKEKLMVEEMTNQISRHPELMEVFQEMAALKRTYDTRRQSR